MSTRRHGAASIAAVLFSSLLLSSQLALSRSAGAQAPEGYWADAFDHEHTGANATPYVFPGASQPAVVDFQPGGVFGWGDWGNGKFNAIHMALIPKGPYRGHVLVWNWYPVYVDVGPTYSVGTDRYWACQAWSIVNPAFGAPAPRFRNFLLPMTPAGNSPPSIFTTVTGAGLFCAGHAWSPFGDLVVAGGDKFTYTPPATGYTQAVGADWLFLFDPSASSAPFPFGGATGPLYPSEFGAWIPAPPPGHLVVDRYYPTVTLTHRLTRIPGFEETMIIAGGTVDPSLITVPGPGGDDPQNTYESYIVRPNVSGGLPFLQQDIVTGTTQPLYRGSGTTTVQTADWFLEYPRLNLLSDGHLFMSGSVANGVRWDPEAPYPASAPFPPPTGTFDYGIGPGSTSVWGQLRHDGTTVFLPRYGALQDVVLRLGGLSAGGVATASSEFCLASSVGAPWVSLGDITGTVNGRDHSNAVVLPDGSVLAIGGDDATGAMEPVVARYTPASSWINANTSPTKRDYHATALLLPDGSVLIGGGNGRHGPGSLSPHDYDVYRPWYMSGYKRPENVVLFGAPQLPDGTYLLNPNQTNVALQATMPGMASLSRAVLTAPGAITHHTDMSARYVDLTSSPLSAARMKFDVPSETVAPRGYYLLWAIDNSGVPSSAIWVRIQ